MGALRVSGWRNSSHQEPKLRQSTAKYFIGGVDEFDGAISRLPVPLTARVCINTWAQRVRGTETTTLSLSDDRERADIKLLLDEFNAIPSGLTSRPNK